ncbi:MAG: type II secretion system protein N [Acidiferrobacter sp.]
MKRRVVSVLLVLLIYAAFLLATAPARVALSFLAHRLPPSVRLADVRGTIWSGRLALLWQTPLHTETLSRVHFGFSALSLLYGKLGYVLHFAGPLQGHVRAAFGPRSMELTHLKLMAHATTLAALMPSVQNWGPTGVVQIKATHLAWGPHLGGQGELTWMQAALVSAPVSPLGSYAASFSMHNGALHYRVQTLTGRLRVAGRGRYVVATHILSFAGDVFGRGLRLGGLVQNVGVPDGHGGRAVSFAMPI